MVATRRNRVIGGGKREEEGERHGRMGGYKNN